MTATYPPRTGLRPCRLYRFYVTHPLTGEVVLGYVGETGRQPFERLLEHLSTQPWFDTAVRWEVDPQVFYGKTAVLKAESAAIRAERPLYNVKCNERNSGRIIPPDAIRQRRTRDAANGSPRWVHPDDRSTELRPDRASPVRQRPSAAKPWSPLRKRMVGWGITWPGSTLVLWLFALLKWHLGGWEQTLIASTCALPAAVTVFCLVVASTAKPKTRRKAWRAMIGRRR